MSEIVAARIRKMNREDKIESCRTVLKQVREILQVKKGCSIIERAKEIMRERG